MAPVPPSHGLSRITESYRCDAPRVKGKETPCEGSGQRAGEGTEAQGLKGEPGESGDQSGALCGRELRGRNAGNRVNQNSAQFRIHPEAPCSREQARPLLR